MDIQSLQALLRHHTRYTIQPQSQLPERYALGAIKSNGAGTWTYNNKSVLSSKEKRGGASTILPTVSRQSLRQN